jgi:hypothetical protein
MASAKGIAIVGWKVITDEKISAAVKQDFELDKKMRNSYETAPRVIPTGGCC